MNGLLDVKSHKTEYDKYSNLFTTFRRLDEITNWNIIRSLIAIKTILTSCNRFINDSRTITGDLEIMASHTNGYCEEMALT